MDAQDSALLARVTAEMKRLAFTGATEEETKTLYFPPDHGVSLVPLLAMLYGNAGESETARAFKLDVASLGEYISFLDQARKALEISDEEMEELYNRISLRQ